MDYEGKSDKQSKCVLVMRTKKEKIWENSQPTIDDFKRYIASPTAVKWYREVVKRKNITIPRYGEGEYLGTVNYILDEDIVKFDRQI